MSDNTVKFICTLWGSAVALIATRYLCASIMVAGALGDKGTYNMALEALGPFLPVLSTICLLGGTAFAIAEAVFAIRSRKK